MAGNLQGGEFQPADMATMSHADLYNARRNVAQALQDQIAPYEHRAAAREAVTADPWMAASYGVAIPAYQIYKAIMPGPRSAGSPEQVKQAYMGILEGLLAQRR